MALKIIQQVQYCPYCNKQTVCSKNTKEMSWLMHLVLAFFTLGFWIIIWAFTAFVHILTKPIAGSWICSECGQPINTFQQNINSTQNTYNIGNKELNLKQLIFFGFLGMVLFSVIINNPKSLVIFASVIGIYFLIKKIKAQT